MKVLLTGGTGYIGSHTAVELINTGKDIAIVDSLINSNEDVVERIKQITGKEPKFYKTDILDKEAIDKIFAENEIDAVIHFAGLKAVGESVEKPLEYYYNNIMGTLTLLDVMRKHNCKKIVFSSSATVYGDPGVPRLVETMGRRTPTNPYGATKAMIEKILEDLYISDNSWKITILRYFNPIGAHESGLLGDNPNGIPNNLMPYIQKVAIGELEKLHVFGDDYETKDGTGVRDYIHVVDLAKGHILALEKLLSADGGVEKYNLGTGCGYSVLELVKTFEKVNNIKIPYVIDERRPGDIAACYADASKAEAELGWKATKTLEDMCRDSWRYIQMNK
ncbi:MAG: UDP-glucose 4-epimerase GalE [Clostridia bacterium]|nr:UDP-glucose 4-epimerase GalE [Clostridia bacterium]